ncbi:4'-phosphopantetheinyl transferase superfamily protein [Caballeronia sp. M1242]|uniref:4'-phosphopantetheinyl transferase superfamily protein n=1 Tax=Caballeronia sp. M1242 TaxID=2814653 RepID=UPI0019D0A655|nr:4'-phosphopantetheinyl transferase superfamily protein [Caballeronia sp. M1242]QSN63666.1 4'-phosphopantetheinyl transferase superfamily protein [Caballeronia sp. M1242]
MTPPCTPLSTESPADVRAWLVDIDLSASLREAGDGVLHPDELERAARFLRHEDAARFATMRAALRRLLAAQLGGSPASLALVSDANGRPTLAIPNAPDLNIAHSGALGLIAMSFERRVGVDIEEARHSFDWRELQATVLHAADQRVIDALPQADQSDAFFACWTAKEAVLKAHGVGIGSQALGMHGFSVLPRDGARYSLSNEAGAFRAVSLAVPRGYAAALAWSAK